MTTLSLIVVSLFNIFKYIIKHLEQNVIKGQGHSTNTQKSLFLAQVVISCLIVDFNAFLLNQYCEPYNEK